MAEPALIKNITTKISKLWTRIFESDSWTKGNTGHTKNHNNNNDFEMKYRVVYSNKRLLDNSECIVKKHMKTLILLGSGKYYSTPKA